MIHARDLVRSFKTKTGVVEAVKGLSLDVAEGELVAFLGPNGAGKSTSVRMLTTLLEPDSGSANIAGFDIARDPAAVRKRLGYVGQGTGSGPYHRVKDELVTQGQALRMKRSVASDRADELLHMLELDGLADRDAASLSGGQRRRLDVALGLMHTPPILFLDEPSTGLDPHSRANLWEHILKLRQSSGMTIFLTTHYLDEADAMAERVMIMDGGRMIANDTPERLKADLAGDTISLTFRDAGDAATAATIAERTDGKRELSVSGAGLKLVVADGEGRLPGLIVALRDAGIDVLAASVKRPTLDDVFLGLTGRSLREQQAAA